MVTLKGLALLVVLTYAALVCLVFLVTNELPSLADLDWEHKLELYTLVSVHCALALLTSATVWVHLGLRTHTAAGVSNLDGPGMASPILTATPLDRRRHEYVHEHHCHDSPGPGDQAEYYDCTRISKDGGCCAVCLDGPADALIEPCRHLALCYTCAASIIESARPECPICRVQMQDVLQVYLST
eukprot:TRINITY_DN11210_c0_g1_i4.p1 TRINITY_DN11210_c0_g1~~TRINITY_DN11210_c0_g1_i4.p1  ORF type:complete len:185 (-),score=25.87 TRINITY_DN11210_c0_g1_i4:115-669(-)